MLKRKYFVFFLFFLLIFSLDFRVNALGENEVSEIYNEQLEISGADRLFSSLPQKTKEMLSEMGITSLNYDTFQNWNIQNIFSETAKIISLQSKTPFSSMAVCMGILLLCSFIENFHTTIGEKSLKGVSNTIGTLSICTALVIPICSMIKKTTEIINGASGFLLLYLPIMAGLTAASGKEAAAGSYYTSMMLAGEVITQLSSKVITPFMNIFLCLSVTSGISPKLNLNGICQEVYKIAKLILTFSMSIFVTMLSLQTIVSSSLDNVSKRALKFAVSSFVPVVGGVVSETINTVSGSMELLRSGAGVFVIIASAFVFLPVIIECFLWKISIFILEAVSDLIGLGKNPVCQSVLSLISMLLAVILCILIIFIISTVILLMIAR